MTEAVDNGIEKNLTGENLRKIASWLSIERLEELSSFIGQKKGELSADDYFLAGLSVSSIPVRIKVGNKEINPFRLEGLKVEEVEGWANWAGGEEKKARGDKEVADLCKKLREKGVFWLAPNDFMNARLTLMLAVWRGFSGQDREEFWKKILSSQFLISAADLRPLKVRNEKDRWKFLGAIYLLVKRGIIPDAISQEQTS